MAGRVAGGKLMVKDGLSLQEDVSYSLHATCCRNNAIYVMNCIEGRMEENPDDLPANVHIFWCQSRM
uniref:Uncharacterized protein n=1 Tax=Oryza nivara TaxID=4536 RepID=A0A0E0G5Q0_ORYNI